MRPPRPYLFFACTATILAILWNGNVVSQGVRPDPKDAVDFILVIDMAAPRMYTYYPNDWLFKPGSVAIQSWTLQMLMKLMDSGHSKGIDTRVLVFIVGKDRASAKKEAEYYSRDHTRNKDYDIPGLTPTGRDDFFPQRDPPIITADLLRLLKGMIDAIRPANRMGVPEIFVWHIPFDGTSLSDLAEYRQWLVPMGDALVALEHYYWEARLPTLRVMISHASYAKDFQIHYTLPKRADVYRDSHQDKVIDAMWVMFYSCRSNVKSMPCSFSKTGICIIKNLYMPVETGATAHDKFCRSGTQVLDCPYGRQQCEWVCDDGSEEGQCSATCGDGTKVKRPKDPENELTKYCKWVPLPCHGPPCDQPPETTKPPKPKTARTTVATTKPKTAGTTLATTKRTRSTHSVSSATSTTAAVEGIGLESWMIAVIAVACAALLCTIICIIAVCLCQRKRKRALMNQQRPPAHHRHGQTGGSHTRTGHGGRRYPWSRRGPSPSHPRHVQSPSRPRTTSPSRPRTTSPSRPRTTSPSRPRTTSPSRPRTTSPSPQRTKSPGPSSPMTNLPAYSHIRREGATGTVSASLLKSPSPHRTQSPRRPRTKHGQSSPKAYRPASTHIHREGGTGTVSASLLTVE